MRRSTLHLSAVSAERGSIAVLPARRVLGRAGEALEMKLRAFERDPLSPLVHVQVAQCCWNQRRYDEAIEWAHRALALDARHLLAREFLASAYLFKDDFDRYSPR